MRNKSDLRSVLVMINLKGYWSVKKITDFEQYQLDNTNDINRSESNCIYTSISILTIAYYTVLVPLLSLIEQTLFCPVTCGVVFPCELPVCGLPGPFTNEAESVNWVFQIKKLGKGRDDTNGRLPIEQPFILAMSCFCANVAAKAIADASLAWTKSMSVVFRVFRILVIPPTRFDCLKPGCQAGLPKD